MRAILTVLSLSVFTSPLLAQSRAIDAYLQADTAKVTGLAAQAPDKRAIVDVQDLLPHRISGRYVLYMKARSYPALLDAIDANRLNKLVGGTSGGGGTTSLVSLPSVPAVLGFGIEHGSILQQQDKTVTTLRANLRGLGELVAGPAVFPYCAEVQLKGCKDASRQIRRFSGSLAFEDSRETKGTASAASKNSAPATVQLFGSDFRMMSWGARFDLTLSQNLDDPAYVKAWNTEIGKLVGEKTATDLSMSINDFFTQGPSKAAYKEWMDQTVPLLQSAVSAGDIRRVLERQLDLLGPMMAAADPEFAKRFTALARAYSNYDDVRDGLVRNAQRHKMAAEYVNLHPRGEPNRSSLRFIYSHQPGRASTLVTANAAVTYYNGLPAGTAAGRMRDVQVAGQLDQRLGGIPRLASTVLTLGAYYQWMKDDALIKIGEGDTAPGSGIVLPGSAAKLLGTRGHIGIAQARLSLPVTDSMKLPISVTVSNRTELIRERQVRGQIGLTFDFDKFFR